MSERIIWFVVKLHVLDSLFQRWGLFQGHVNSCTQNSRSCSSTNRNSLSILFSMVCTHGVDNFVVYANLLIGGGCVGSRGLSGNGMFLYGLHLNCGMLTGTGLLLRWMGVYFNFIIIGMSSCNANHGCLWVWSLSQDLPLLPDLKMSMPWSLAWYDLKRFSRVFGYFLDCCGCLLGRNTQFLQHGLS